MKGRWCSTVDFKFRDQRMIWSPSLHWGNNLCELLNMLTFKFVLHEAASYMLAKLNSSLLGQSPGSVHLCSLDSLGFFLLVDPLSAVG